MRRLFCAFLVLFSSYTFAADGVKVEVDIVCYPLETMLKMLKKFGEEPMLIGKRFGMDKVATVVYLNKETGAYTIVEMDAEAGCVISLGKDAFVRYPVQGM